MNINKKSIVFAAFCFFSAPSMAVEYKYSTYNLGQSVADPGKTDAIPADILYAGKFFQYFGRKSSCNTSATSCTHTVGSGSTVSASWKTGVSATTKLSVDSWVGVDVQVSSEFGKIVTDSDNFTYSTTYGPGKTAESATYVERYLDTFKFYGAWDYVGRARCAVILNCYKYQWNPDKYVGSISALTTTSTEQTYTTLIYKTGQRPDYVLEAD